MTPYIDIIVRVLYEAGQDGLRLKLISRHVYNNVNSLFEPADREAIHLHVARFIPANAKGRAAMFKKCSHGVYALNMRSPQVRAILAANDILTTTANNTNDNTAPTPDTQPSLFNDDDFQ